LLLSSPLLSRARALSLLSRDLSPLLRSAALYLLKNQRRIYRNVDLANLHQA
jgi:hypothetical protein